MYTSTAIRIPCAYRTNTIGYQHADTNRYVYTGHDGVYIQTNTQLRIFYDNVYTCTHYVNIVPFHRTPSYSGVDMQLYKGTLQDTSITIECYTYPPCSSFLGQTLTSTAYRITADMDTAELVADGDVYVNGIVNSEVILHYAAKAYNTDVFCGISNALCVSTYNAVHETLLYPFAYTRYTMYEHLFEGNEQETAEFHWCPIQGDMPSFNETITLNRPRFLFSADVGETWYAYNTITKVFDLKTPVGDYFTLAEFQAVANTYADYCTIPISAYITAFGSEIAEQLHILTTGYLFPRVINHTVWTDALSTQEYIRNLSTEGKRVILSGTV